MATVLYLWRMLVSFLLLLIPALLLLLLLWALHFLAPCMVSARLVLNHYIGAHAASASAVYPFLKTTSVLLLIPPPAVDIVATAGGVAAVPAIAVAVPLVVSAIDLWGPKVARLYYCYSGVPLFVALVCALGVVSASA